MSNLVKYEQYPEFAHCRDEIKYNGTAKDFAIGDLVAADGTVPATAADIAGIVLYSKSAEASTDTAIIVLSLIKMKQLNCSKQYLVLNQKTLKLLLM